MRPITTVYSDREKAGRSVGWLLVCLCICCAAVLSDADTLSAGSIPGLSPEVTVDHKIKAVFIYKIMRYVEWSRVGDTDRFKIGVVGESPVLSVLQSLAITSNFDRQVVVQQVESIADTSGCHILFVGANGPFEKAIPTIPGLLTIGEAPGFTDRGGILNLRSEASGKVSFEVNLRSARVAGLKISSKLLRLAEVTR